MKKLFLLIGLLLSFPVYAEELSETEQIATTENETVQTVEQATVEEVDPLAPDVIEEEEVVVEQVPQEQILPSCDDETLLQTVSNLLHEYDAENPVESLYDKRQRALQLKYLNNYEEDQVAGYTSAQNQEVADKLLMTKINEGLDDEEIRLCKSKLDKNSRFKPVYVIVYQDKVGLMQVSILNFKADGSGELNSVLGE